MQFEFGGAEALDLFYNADVAVTDLTSRKIDRNSMFYQLGVRDSMGQDNKKSECILTFQSEVCVCEILLL